MDEIYVYLIPMPASIKEMVTPCVDGYTIYLNDALDQEARTRAYQHALEHIRRGDFDLSADHPDVQQIELDAHQTAGEPPREAAPTKPKRKRRTLTEAYLRKQAKRAAALAKHGLYETVEFVDGEEGEIVARRVLHA